MLAPFFLTILSNIRLIFAKKMPEFFETNKAGEFALSFSTRQDGKFETMLLIWREKRGKTNTTRIGRASLGGGGVDSELIIDV